MRSFVVDHYIQREILRSLSRARCLRFSELRPDGLENSSFVYHLRQLVQQGLVDKDGRLYTLSPAGMSYVARLTRTNLDLLPQPRLFSLLVIANDRGELVMHPRNAQPYINRLTFPGGALVFDEELRDHLDRQLQEKVGFKLPMEHRGVASLRVEENGEVITHIYAQIFYTFVEGRPEVRAQDQRFAPQWVDPTKVSSADIMPDIQDILERLVRDEEHFFLDLKRAIER